MTVHVSVRSTSALRLPDTITLEPTAAPDGGR
jgi:hypothetical protein